MTVLGHWSNGGPRDRVWTWFSLQLATSEARIAPVSRDRVVPNPRPSEHWWLSGAVPTLKPVNAGMWGSGCKCPAFCMVWVLIRGVRWSSERSNVCHCGLVESESTWTEQVVSSIPGRVGYISYPMFTEPIRLLGSFLGSLGTYGLIKNVLKITRRMRNHQYENPSAGCQ